MVTPQANIGVVGLAVMGSNLARNLASRDGNTVAIYNRSPERTRLLVSEHPEAGFVASENIDDFVASLAKPRTAIIMVQAGAGTDAVISQLAERFEAGDIIVDGGNSYWGDSIRRHARLAELGFRSTHLGNDRSQDFGQVGLEARLDQSKVCRHAIVLSDKNRQLNRTIQAITTRAFATIGRNSGRDIRSQCVLNSFQGVLCPGGIVCQKDQRRMQPILGSTLGILSQNPSHRDRLSIHVVKEYQDHRFALSVGDRIDRFAGRVPECQGDVQWPKLLIDLWS